MQRSTVVTGGTIGFALLVVLLLWLSPSASGSLEVSLRHATDNEADNHRELINDTGQDLLVAEIRNTSQDTIGAVHIAIPDHLPVHAAVLEAPNRDASLPLTGLLWPADQVATSNRGWNTGRLDPGQHATLYLATDPPAHHITIRATATGITPITGSLHGPTLFTRPPGPSPEAGLGEHHDDRSTEALETGTEDEALSGFSWQRHERDALGGESQQHVYSVAAGGPGLVAVGSVLRPTLRYSGAVWTSIDGLAWERIEHDEAAFGSDSSQRIRSVTTGGPGLVAVGYDRGRGTALVWTSTDGLTWQRVEHDPAVFGEDSQSDASLRMTSVTAGGPGLVAVGVETAYEDDIRVGAAAVWTSVDGLTWQRVDNDEQVFGGERRQGMVAVVAGGPGVVAVGWDEKWATGPELVGGYPAVWTSTDGLEWQRVEHDPAVFGTDDNLIVRSVSAGGPGLVAVGGDNAREEAAVWTSTDGLTWQRVEPDQAVFAGEDRPMMQSVTTGGPGLVAVGHQGGLAQRSAAVWTSPDGLTWQRVEHDQTVFGDFSSQMMSVTAGGPGLVAVGYQAQQWSAVMWTSP